MNTNTVWIEYYQEYTLESLHCYVLSNIKKNGITNIEGKNWTAVYRYIYETRAV